MRALMQRVDNAGVEIENKTAGKIKKGVLVFLGINERDSEKDIDYLVEKIINLRIFEDEDQRMNLSLLDIKGEILIVSQFTLYGDCRKGRRPSYDKAAKPEFAEKLYNKFIEKIRMSFLRVETGVFGKDMKVKLTNSGPVTMLLDSFKEF
ncbi:MAG: D-aminoacyl-tRNA deacylase [Thermodesulfobacteriota bacterium]